MENIAMKKTPNPIDVHVGSRVRLARNIINMSQEKLGDSLGITFQQVQKYEKGTNRISASRLQQMVGILHVSGPGWFFLDAPGSAVQSPDLRSEADMIVSVLQSHDGVRLAQAFARITSPAARRKLVELAQIIASATRGANDTDGGDEAPKVGAGPAPKPVAEAGADEEAAPGADQPVPWGSWGKKARTAEARV